MNNLQYEFAPTANGVGFNDPVSTRFRGRFSYYLVRESVQNALDQPDLSKNAPVKVKFSLSTLPARKIPEANQLARIFKSCMNWRYLTKESAKFFYKNAIDNIIDNKSVSILKISDYNTTGFTDDGYYAFLKSVGVSTKSTGGGSWGLGKGSYFASSSFRTIFVTSIKKSGQHIFQGKLFLSSWIDEKNRTMDGIGSYGYENQEPVTDKVDIPEIFKREEQGTDFYILGFMEKSNWEEQIIASVLINFWPAIYDNKLVVEVGDRVIDSGSMEDIMSDFFSRCQDKNLTELNPLPYFQAYKNPDHLIFSGQEKNYPILKDIRLFIQFGEDYQDKIAYSRRSRMVVQTKPSYYSPKHYAAFFICDNADGDAILRDMENPEHDRWSANNPDINPKTGKPHPKYVKAEQELKDFIKKSFDELTEAEASEELSIHDLENYLWLPAEEDTASGEYFSAGDLNNVVSAAESGSETGSTEDERLRQKIKVHPINKIDTEKKVTPDEEGEIDIPGKGGGHGGHHKQKGTEDENGENQKVSVPIKCRAFVPGSTEGKQSHVLIIRGTQNANCNIELKAGTDNSFLPISIYKATGPNEETIDFENNVLKNVLLGPNGRTKLRVIFIEPGKYSLKAEAYANI